MKIAHTSFKKKFIKIPLSRFTNKTYGNLKKLSNENILPFITTFNPNNPNIYSTIKSSVNCLKNNNNSGFHYIKLIQSKCQSPNLKKRLTKVEFGGVLSGTFSCSDKRCECCNYFLIDEHYTFKNVQITSHATVLTLYML